jgi:hypothetical protein
MSGPPCNPSGETHHSSAPRLSGAQPSQKACRPEYSESYPGGAHELRNELLKSSEPVEKCASLTREECEYSLVKEDP